jgi:glucose uptake protein GlcU
MLLIGTLIGTLTYTNWDTHTPHTLTGIPMLLIGTLIGTLTYTSWDTHVTYWDTNWDAPIH